MSLRRMFLLGAATIVSLAALVAITAILTGGFGTTDAKIFGTLATAFVAAATAVAGMACLERDVAQAAGVFGIAVASIGFILWTEEIWAEHGSGSYWKVLGLVLIWTIAALIVTTTRLMARSLRIVRTLSRPTGAAAVAAGFVVSLMVLRESGDGWQLFSVLLVLAVLGEILTPIAQRYVTESSRSTKTT
jgi:hypothetical protein